MYLSGLPNSYGKSKLRIAPTTFFFILNILIKIMDFPKTAGIYKITNIISGKYYIGSSNNLSARKGSHLSLLRRGKHSNKHLQASFNKNKEESFAFEVVETFPNATVKEIRELEQIYLDNIQDWSLCYNVLKDTRPDAEIIPTSERTRKKMSENNKGAKNPNFGKKPSEETRLRMSKSRRIRGCGVTKYSEDCWGVNIKIEIGNNKKVCLGRYETEEMARQVRKVAEEFYFDGITEKQEELEKLFAYRKGVEKDGKYWSSPRVYGAGVRLVETGSWAASIFYNEKAIELGRYQTEEEARLVRNLAEKVYWDGCSELAEELHYARSKAKTKRNQKRRGVGVSVNRHGTYTATITVNNKTFPLGNFPTEAEAREHRTKAEKYYYDGDESFTELFNKPKKERQLPVGVYQKYNKFFAMIHINNKPKRVGSFNTPEEARLAREAALQSLLS
jgi:group I intron endonuclease